MNADLKIKQKLTLIKTFPNQWIMQFSEKTIENVRELRRNDLISEPK